MGGHQENRADSTGAHRTERGEGVPGKGKECAFKEKDSKESVPGRVRNGILIGYEMVFLQFFSSFSPESDHEVDEKEEEVVKENGEKPIGKKETPIEAVPDEPKGSETAVEVRSKTQKKRNRNRKKKETPEKSGVVTPSKPPVAPAVKKGGIVKAKKAFIKSHPKKLHKNIKELDKKDATHISENRLRALGINPKKYQNKLIYGKND